ncbi:hypothetical protein HDZ31DRAFT_65660 [Schizophyllum fasciatum]
MAHARQTSASSIDAQLERFRELDAIYNRSPLPGLQIQPVPQCPPYSIVVVTKDEEQGLTVDPRALAVFTITVHDVAAIAHYRCNLSPAAGVGAQQENPGRQHEIAVHNAGDVKMLSCPDNADRTLYIDLTVLEKAATSISLTPRHGGNRWGEQQVIGLDIHADVPAPPAQATATNNVQRSPPRRVLGAGRPARRLPNPAPPTADPQPTAPIITFSLTRPIPAAARERQLPPIPPPFPAAPEGTPFLQPVHEEWNPVPVARVEEKRESAAQVGMQRTKRRAERYSPYGSRPVKRVVYSVVSTAADGLTYAGGLLRGWADLYLGDVPIADALANGGHMHTV